MLLSDNDIASLSDAEARAFANFLIRKSRSRRHAVDLLGHIADALSDPRGAGHNHVERVRDFVRQIVREQIEATCKR